MRSKYFAKVAKVSVDEMVDLAAEVRCFALFSFALKSTSTLTLLGPDYILITV